LLKLKPDISIKTVDQFYKMFCFDPKLLERIEKGLRLAGLREEVVAAGTPAPTRSSSSASASLPGQQ
jgi:hypothetical protein